MTGLLGEVRSRRGLPPPWLAKRIRVEAGVSQARLAEELGVQRVTVARWEAGTRRPRQPLAQQYSDLLAQLQKEITR